MENSPTKIDEDLPERSAEEFSTDFTPSWQADSEPADRKRDLKERYFLTRKELRDCQRLLALREEELRKLRLAERRQVEQTHQDENTKASLGRLQKRVDELQRQLTDSRNQLRQARTEAAERSAMVPLLEKEAGELREQLEQGEERLGELTGLLEQRERELQEKNGSLHEARELSDRLDQRERDLLEREEELHEAREQLGAGKGEIETARQALETLTGERDNALQQLGNQRGEIETARQALETLTGERDDALQQLGAQRGEIESTRLAMETLTGERDELALKLSHTEASSRNADDTINMLQEKLVEAGEELVKLEESVRDYRYLMDTLKREKADLESASSRAVEELEQKIETSNSECEGLRELLEVRRQDQALISAEKDEMAARLEQAANSHREEIASLEQVQAGKIEELRAESTRELTGVLQAHAQDIDKLKMMHAGERGELRESANRLQRDLEKARERSGRLQLELGEAHESAGHLRSELDDARQGIPRLVARVEEREQAITDTRTMLVGMLTRLEGLDQPPEIALDNDLLAGQDDDENWPAHQTFGDYLDHIEGEATTEEGTASPSDVPPTT